MRLTKTRLSLLCALASLLFAVSCARNDNASNDANAETQAAAATPAQTPTPAPQGRVEIFRGTLGDDPAIRVQMKLRREGDQLKGSYFYENVRNELALRGTIDAQGNFNLQETDSSGAQTGVFLGKRSNSASGAAELTGTWSKPDGSRTLRFRLEEMPVEFSSNLALVSRQIREENPERRYTIYAEYPQIEGATDARVGDFNQRARSLVVSKIEEFKRGASERVAEEMPTETGSDISIGFDVGMATDDLISVRFQISDYYRGAAHPNHHTETLNYNLKTGRALSLGDLFKPDALYLRRIAEHSIADLKRQSRAQGGEPFLDDAQIEEGASANAKNYRSWLITRRGLEITFDPYQVGPYAVGPQTVLVPYAALRDIIGTDGPLAPFVG